MSKEFSNEVKVTLESAVKIAEEAKATGKFFGISFIKRTNGEIRDMQCRGHVTKHLKGGELAFNPREKNLLVVWDATIPDNTKAYRMINLDSILRITFEGITYKVKDK